MKANQRAGLSWRWRDRLEQRWLLRCPGSRELEVTREGRLGLVELLGVDPSALFE